MCQAYYYLLRLVACPPTLISLLSIHSVVLVQLQVLIIVMKSSKSGEKCMPDLCNRLTCTLIALGLLLVANKSNDNSTISSLLDLLSSNSIPNVSNKDQV